MEQDNADLTGFIRRLPKAELHLHLEGTILPSTLVELSARHDARPIPLAEAESLYRFTDFTGFIEGFKAVCQRLIGRGLFDHRLDFIVLRLDGGRYRRGCRLLDLGFFDGF